ncbi:uncharacterized protein J4E88_000105 [Alternaria novae-zelandiae]|uniref:uncharacterized protein n=1 Tax=Alternaria novae-zelandiae TaxID=430562 RepID=UPI0020C2EA64|nr:uncharacterized protein J4E88_000105 [Alternaria novae-zelandiae]KAI4695935.1 hypothetical protein J4E88_000105 [Alternaria novae-zelandiae]
MVALKGFCRLPRELRDQIYAEYFTIEGGYHYDHAANKLVTAAGDGIDLNVRLTNRQVAVETRGLAFKLNAVNFSTVYDRDLNQRAGNFNTLVTIINDLKGRYFLIDAQRSRLFDAKVRTYVEEHHPHFLPVLDALEAGSVTNSDSYVWKETPSQSRHFVESTLHVMAAQPDFNETVTRASNWHGRDDNPRPDPFPVVAHHHVPWSLPSEEELAAMREIVSPHPIVATRFKNWQYWEKEKYRLSAATTSIAFLGSLTCKTRLELRNLVLHEDHVAVAWPECHVQGLIPFCQENSKLRIERRVSLWKAMLPAAAASLYAIMTNPPAAQRRSRYDCVPPQILSRGSFGYSGVADWIMEALALESLGMPSGCFTFVIDGEPTPEQSTRVFNILQHNAAWQTAYDLSIHDSTVWPVPLTWLQGRDHKAYIMRGFPDALKAISAGRSVVKCDIDTGLGLDVDKIIAEGRSWTQREWLENWSSTVQLHGNIHTSDPLPSWIELRMEDMLEEEGTE